MIPSLADISTTAQTYADFAEKEARGRSPLYVEVCLGISRDTEFLPRLAALPKDKRQPNLLLAAVKYLHGTSSGWSQFRDLALTDWDRIAAIVAARRTQTNEPARCATLLPLLARLPQPLALLEVGASAGLCLLPDYYDYDFGGHRVFPSRDVHYSPLFHCEVNAATPLPERNIEVAWRAGLDINPLDPTSEEDTHWLKALVWPGEGDRERLLDEALSVARTAKPRVVRGDLRTDLAVLAAEAPQKATLVIYHTAVLAYVTEPADRLAFKESVAALGAQWISNESASLSDWKGATPAIWGSFILALNGAPIARTDAHGTRLHWLA